MREELDVDESDRLNVSNGISKGWSGIGGGLTSSPSGFCLDAAPRSPPPSLPLDNFRMRLVLASCRSFEGDVVGFGEAGVAGVAGLDSTCLFCSSSSVGGGPTVRKVGLLEVVRVRIREGEGLTYSGLQRSLPDLSP